MDETAVFSAVPGRIVMVLPAGDAQAFRLIMKSIMGGPVYRELDPARNAAAGDIMIPGISTGVRIAQRVAAQFQVTLDESLFVVPFGDEAGQMTLTLVHGMECDKNSSGGTTSVIDGVQKAMAWYAKYKFQRKNMQPITVNLGASVFKGYAIGFSIDAQAAEGGMVRSQLDLIAWNVA